MVVQFRSRQAAHHAIVAGASVSETLQKAQARGIERSCLPVSVGGTFTDSKFQDWIRLRISVEDVLSSCPLRVNDALRFRAIANQQKKQQQQWLSQSAAISTAACSTTNTQNRNNNKQRAPTTSTATAMVPLARHRHSRKVASPEVAKLQEQIKTWEERNQSVKMDNHRLEAHLSAARLLVAVHNSVESAVKTATTHIMTTATAATTTVQDNSKPHASK